MIIDPRNTPTRVADNKELAVVEQKEQLNSLEEAHGQLEDVKQSLDDAQYQANDLESMANGIVSYLSDLEYNLDEAIGQVEWLVEEIRSAILAEANNEANKA